MTGTDDKTNAEREIDTSKGPVGGQGQTAPKVDPKDGAAIDGLTHERQPETGPKG